ncbi:MAG: hypothetical protein A2600_08925 [Candidatus Lambdaproteobacteria bacterium RIFOXYD1_FULL_56_27]|uniref:DNA translocase FtsK 4TM region domain-containing protein n=1 Tax=Candidatus Lambdaproteobacteria bacterium RIFOXYD2_FULL_56_26 TaxID=1817773 RepID=A0A1F6GZ42_9PROT|nr:MAG: hypothetical protein A2426_10345 [Candidatus Lambdaproteobacteria bacterium RIFOXYC1_FULL_56_13]OGH03342.1 MAG: hypothetical protein A2557_02340 [Candidatus Lambdaproteobacteria bacterium RIFOXYD2_FULL_56_26]OGH06653.1 MAG: hypothetical protein A2600_08925 [Candidatus Lambdaproteobacteria bacterium RIFOXYD1_FULL_56_27]
MLNWPSLEPIFSEERPERFRPELVKIVLGLLILFTLVSQGPFDPDPMNLVWPAQGIENWFGLPGAMFAGFWLRFFGWSSLMLVVFLLFSQSTQRRFALAFVAAVIHFLGFALLVGLLFPTGHPRLEQASGLYGLMGNQALGWIGVRFLGVLVLTAFLIKASMNYRLKNHFLVFLFQGVLGVLAMAEMFKETFMGLKALSPSQLKQSLMAEPASGFGQNDEDTTPEPGQYEKVAAPYAPDDALMRAALEALEKNPLGDFGAEEKNPKNSS